MNIPTISHPTDRPNFSIVTVPGATYWFSYSTCIAMQRGSEPRVVSENCWGPTTGKHLNYIDGGNTAARLDRAEFEKLLTEGG